MEPILPFLTAGDPGLDRLPGLLAEFAALALATLKLKIE